MAARRSTKRSTYARPGMRMQHCAAVRFLYTHVQPNGVRHLDTGCPRPGNFRQYSMCSASAYTTKCRRMQNGVRCMGPMGEACRSDGSVSWSSELAQRPFSMFYKQRPQTAPTRQQKIPEECGTGFGGPPATSGGTRVPLGRTEAGEGGAHDPESVGSGRGQGKPLYHEAEGHWWWKPLPMPGQSCA